MMSMRSILSAGYAEYEGMRSMRGPEMRGYCQIQIVIVMTGDNPIVVDGVTGEGPV